MADILCLGPPGAGKTSLLTALKLVDTLTSSPAPIKFGFSARQPVVRAWVVNKGEYLDLLKILLMAHANVGNSGPGAGAESESTSRLHVHHLLLVLDATRPWLIPNEIQGWLSSLATHGIAYDNITIMLNKVDLLRADGGIEADNRLDFCQYYLRHQCLALGASLVYTSAKSGSNLAECKHIILRRSGELKLNAARFSVLVPSGSDAEDLAQMVLKGGLIPPDAPFESIFATPLITEPAEAEGLSSLNGKAFNSRLAAITSTSQVSPTKPSSVQQQQQQQQEKTTPLRDPEASDDVLGYFERLLQKS